MKVDNVKAYVDAEWTSSNTPVSVQILLEVPDFESRTFIVINNLYEKELDLTLVERWSLSNKCVVEFLSLTPEVNVIHYLLEKYYFQGLVGDKVEGFRVHGDFHIFFSFQDIGFAFGWDNVISRLRACIGKKKLGRLEQRRSITGILKLRSEKLIKFGNWRIRDLFGWTNSSLKDFASGLGIEMKYKDELDDLKAMMDMALIEKTEIFDEI